MKFSKPPLSLDEQLDGLTARGMEVGDRATARHYLQHLNYYRLAAYWLPFEANHETHRFRPGTDFHQVLDLYIFDRELRLLVLDAIERVEVSIRTNWAYHMAHAYGPHCLLDRGLFRSDGKWSYPRLLAQLQRDVDASHETFIRHLRAKYDEALPPIWAAVEVTSIGQLSKWYANTRHRRDRNQVARNFDFDESILTSFLHHLAVVRNIAAHHGRLWNREFTFKFKLPKNRPAVLAGSVNRQTKDKLYNTLSALLHLLNQVSPNHHWALRLLDLMQRHQIEVGAMGIPPDWRERPLWAGMRGHGG